MQDCLIIPLQEMTEAIKGNMTRAMPIARALKTINHTVYRLEGYRAIECLNVFVKWLTNEDFFNQIASFLFVTQKGVYFIKKCANGRVAIGEAEVGDFIPAEKLRFYFPEV